MIKSEFAVVWISQALKVEESGLPDKIVQPGKVRVEDTEGMKTWGHQDRKDNVFWNDPIGRSYTQWRTMSPHMRAVLMLETAIDLTMQGYDLKTILREFNKVDCFHDLGSVSAPMCRALTMALLGRCLEPNTMSFEELLIAYKPKEGVS
jgi:hypothetical protein